MARSFSGGTDGINIGSPPGLPTNGSPPPLTLSAWAKGTNATNDGCIFCGNGNGNELIELRWDRAASGAINFVVFNNFAQTSNLQSTSTTAGLLNTWVHVAGVWTSSNTFLYINGSQQATQSFSSTGLFLGSFSSWGIGRDTQNNANSFAGSIADCGLWSVNLSAGEIAALAKGARPYSIRPSSLLGWWPVDGLQSPEPDLSGNKNNGTVTGAALASGPPIMMFTPRWPQFSEIGVAPTFSPAWALNRNRVIEGVAT